MIGIVLSLRFDSPLLFFTSISLSILSLSFIVFVIKKKGVFFESFMFLSVIDFVVLEGVFSNLELFSLKLKEMKNKNIILPKSAKKYDRKCIKVLRDIKKLVIFHGEKDMFSDAKSYSVLKNVKIINHPGGHLQGFQALSKSYLGDMYISYIESLF